MAVMPGSSAELEPRCPICGQNALLEFCDPSGIALCPRCGHLLCWFRGRLTSLYAVAGNGITPDTSFADDLGADSLDIVELITELEGEFDVRISDHEAAGIKTVADAIRFIVRHLRDEAA
jgi:acyl carrier protein